MTDVGMSSKFYFYRPTRIFFTDVTLVLTYYNKRYIFLYNLFREVSENQKLQKLRFGGVLRGIIIFK